jgi:hypothetical protein
MEKEQIIKQIIENIKTSYNQHSDFSLGEVLTDIVPSFKDNKDFTHQIEYFREDSVAVYVYKPKHRIITFVNNVREYNESYENLTVEVLKNILEVTKIKKEQFLGKEQYFSG